MKQLTCFKAYDIRGKLGEELNEVWPGALVGLWRISGPKTIVLGGDVRLTSETFKLALAKGCRFCRPSMLDIGMYRAPKIYFATFHLGVDGGIEVLPAVIRSIKNRHEAGARGGSRDQR
ncbi:hypothetical protein ACVXHA_26070 [Escherichia coli]